MRVEEAIKTRRSIRAFTDQAVEKEKIEQLLSLSQRAPSGTNTQPWHTYVCAGDVKDAISTDALELIEAGRRRTYEEYDYSPAEWKDVHQNRRRGVGWGLYGLLGIEKGDRERTAKQGNRNFRFFDAPVAMFFTTDAYLGRGSWLDTGLYIQTIMLAARGMGLHTCPQAAWIPCQEPVFKHLNIPDDQVLVCGMALGYEDTSAIENTLVSEREDVGKVVTYLGF
jgi:nitroreductase